MAVLAAVLGVTAAGATKYKKKLRNLHDKVVGADPDELTHVSGIGIGIDPTLIFRSKPINQKEVDEERVKPADENKKSTDGKKVEHTKKPVDGKKHEDTQKTKKPSEAIKKIVGQRIDLAKIGSKK